jgi:hypothetical protein
MKESYDIPKDDIMMLLFIIVHSRARLYYKILFMCKHDDDVSWKIYDINCRI